MSKKSKKKNKRKTLTERKKNKIAWKATEKLLKSGMEIKDVFGNLES